MLAWQNLRSCLYSLLEIYLPIGLQIIPWSIKQFRLKAIVLLALTLMLRPSDNVQRGVDVDTGVSKPIFFNTQNVQFLENDYMSITFLGRPIKNDLQSLVLR